PSSRAGSARKRRRRSRACWPRSGSASRSGSSREPPKHSDFAQHPLMSTRTATTPIGPSAAIQTPERQEERSGWLLTLPLDPVLLLAVIGLAVCSILTLQTATRNLIPRQPHYYVDRQIVYLVIGVVAMLALSRIDYARLRHFKNAIYGALILSILAV